MSDYERCVRCQQDIDITSERHLHGEATDDGFVCGNCLTPAEEQAASLDVPEMGAAE
jgi:recombinational DNA repair protein (RecF pathway)